MKNTTATTTATATVMMKTTTTATTNTAGATTNTGLVKNNTKGNNRAAVNASGKHLGTTIHNASSCTNDVSIISADEPSMNRGSSNHVTANVMKSPANSNALSSKITCITFDRQRFDNDNNYNKGNVNNEEGDTESEISSISDIFYNSGTTMMMLPVGPSQPPSLLRVKLWDGKKLLSEFIRDGLRIVDPNLVKKSATNIIMLYESPSCCSSSSTQNQMAAAAASATATATFFNGQTFKFYDYPPSPTIYKSIFGPYRYSMMNGNTFASYIPSDKYIPVDLLKHWNTYIPQYVPPTFISDITKDSIVYAYLPIEHIPNHVNNPHVHYHVCGKDILHLMTRRTPKLLTNTRDNRPCICKMTHSMGNKGIFIIRNDHDEKCFESILANTGNPTFIVTEYVESKRSMSCHFFIYPNSYDITWFGSNENHISRPFQDTNASTKGNALSYDTVIIMKEQETLKKLLLPFVVDVVKYFQARDFWGFCGIDVIFDGNDNGYLVDVNPRVTGSLPAIMVAHQLYNDIYQYEYCIYRRGYQYTYYGTSQQLLDDVAQFNTMYHEKNRECMILVTGFIETDDSADDNHDDFNTKQITTTTTTATALGKISNNIMDDYEEVFYHYGINYIAAPDVHDDSTNGNSKNDERRLMSPTSTIRNGDGINVDQTNHSDRNNHHNSTDGIKRKKTLVQLAVYGKRSLEECEAMLNRFAPYK